MLRFVQDIAVSFAQVLGLETAKFAFGDIFVVLVVSGVAWAFFSAIAGKIAFAIFSGRCGEERVYDALKYVVIVLGVATFYGGFYLYSIGF